MSCDDRPRQSRMPSCETRMESLLERFNEPVIPPATLAKWLAGFSDHDKAAALCLLESVDFHSYPRFIREMRALHTSLQKRLMADGFDRRTCGEVFFSREFTSKSGDLVSYLYRKSNLIPSVRFKSFDRMIQEAEDSPSALADDALVILDDYVGTGSQFIFQFVARSEAHIGVINRFGKIYLCCLVAHESALEKFALLRNGRIDEVIQMEETEFPFVDFHADEDLLRQALQRVDWNKLELVYLQRETPLLCESNGRLGSAERQSIECLLARYEPQDLRGGTASLFGHHAFFYGAPNSLPAILLPLFKRVEDFSIYPTEKFVGVSPDIVNYDIDSIAPGQAARL